MTPSASSAPLPTAASDIDGIGFFSADQVALSLGLPPDSPQRFNAAIRQVLAASREQGRCFLSDRQIGAGALELIDLNLADRLAALLAAMVQDHTSCGCGS